MSTHITAELSVKSLNAARKQIRDYRRKLLAAQTRIARQLANIGLKEATVRFANAQYDGTNDVRVVAEPTATGYIVKANGAAVCFIEFGTGVHYNGTAGSYPLPKPAGITPIGGYGKKHGRHDAWSYIGAPGTNGVVITPAADPLTTQPYVITHGNPANMPMYYASREMCSKVADIVKGVFPIA